MTTLKTTAKTSRAGSRFRLPDIPEKHPDDMTSFRHLAANGNAHHLAVHLGSPETTIVSGERYMCVAPGGAIRYPDLLVAFGVTLSCTRTTTATSYPSRVSPRSGAGDSLAAHMARGH